MKDIFKQYPKIKSYFKTADGVCFFTQFTMKDIFKQYPKIKSYFKTADGVCFFTQFNAVNHAKTLPNKKVMEIKKEQSEKVDKSIKKPTPLK